MPMAAIAPVPMASLRGIVVLGRRSLDGSSEVGLSAMVTANAIGWAWVRLFDGYQYFLISG
jgi:hypothetical protein